MNRQVWMVAAAAGMLAAAIACSSQASAPETAHATTATKAAATPASLERGRSLYKANCTACHGESGRGDGPAGGAMKPAPRDHTDHAYMSTLSDEEIGRVIQMGGAIKGKPLMPSNPQFRGADLEALVAYVRSLSASK